MKLNKATRALHIVYACLFVIVGVLMLTIGLLETVLPRMTGWLVIAIGLNQWATAAISAKFPEADSYRRHLENRSHSSSYTITVGTLFALLILTWSGLVDWTAYEAVTAALAISISVNAALQTAAAQN